MTRKSKLPMLLLVLSLSLLSGSFWRVEASNEETATLAITRAEATVASAYESVLEAEQAGANVSGLLTQLTGAGEYLANATISRSLGDFEDAARFANQSYAIGQEVQTEAYALKNEAYQSWVSSVVVRVTVSLISVAFVGLVSVFVWSAFKRRYYKSVLDMRPEVRADES